MGAEPKKRTRAWIVWASSAALPFLYLLSIRTVDWLYWHGHVSETAARTYCAPERWLGRHSPVAKELIRSYVELWHPWD
jgi:hypothetical protein